MSAIYLFGSQAEGRAAQRSDVDLALLARPDLPHPSLWRREDRWTSELSRLLAPHCTADVFVLNLAPLSVRFQVTTVGRTLLEFSLVVALPATHLLYHGSKSMDRRCVMRGTDKERLEVIWRTLEQEPGVPAGRLAKKLGIPRSSVMRALPSLDGEGLLLSEDQKGRLWPWKRAK